MNEDAIMFTNWIDTRRVNEANCGLKIKLEKAKRMQLNMLVASQK